MVNSPANKTPSALLGYFSLFSSVGTLLCCALPSLLVLAGLGASVASTLSTLPWLVALSHHKPWTFGVSGILIGASFANMYYLAPRLGTHACSPENPEACEGASRFNKVLLWISACLYVVGFFVAFLLGPILVHMDNS
jgi:mercuric ion transport protein